MKLNYDRKSKDPTYFVQQGFRNGKKTTTKNIARIGKHSELLQITNDPLAYAKEQVENFNAEARNNNRVTMDVTVDFGEKIQTRNDLVSSSNLLNIGFLFLQQIYNDLSVDSFFKTVTADSKITFDPATVNRYLTYARILNPGSKLNTFGHLDRYYGQPDFDYVHILRTMDIMEQHYDEYITHLFDYSNTIVKRDTSVCYYDCTNFFFETESPDDDYVDEVTGECIKGLRKNGISKEHRPNPIVEMGLFMDSNGIPISMCIKPGSDSEQTTTVPLEKKMLRMFRGKKFIYCADAGLGSYNIRLFNSMGGRAFVVTQSIKKMSDILKEAVFNDYDYRLLSSGERVSLEGMKSFNRMTPANKCLYNDIAYKVIVADKAVDLGLYEEKMLKNGKTKNVKTKGLLKQKIIITFSRKMMEYQRFIRNRQIYRAEKLLKNLDPETFKKGSHDVTRFIKRTSSTKSGEKATDVYMLNRNVIDEEEKYDGFYAIATNLDDDVKTILDISSKRYKIEDCFRIMKTNLSSRPVYHQNRERIIAHFMICYTALLVYRLLEAKLDAHGQHFTTANIIETLKNMEVTNVQDMYYLSTYNGSQICTALNAVFEIDLDKKYYQPKELNKKLKKSSK
ncbi:IS4 family transposase [Synergistales bacterium]|nr:IS4 family transposase [Synergistales bacterium]